MRTNNGELTGRAFGMLTVFYFECRALVKRFKNELASSSVTDETYNALKEKAGHGALIKIAINKFDNPSNHNLRLSAFSDSEFLASLDGFKEDEKKFFTEGRSMWLSNYR